MQHRGVCIVNDDRSSKTHIAFLREVVALHDRAGSKGGAALSPERARGLLAEIDALTAALAGLLTFRDDKAEWERLSDTQLKPLLDSAFQRAREALAGSPFETTGQFVEVGELVDVQDDMGTVLAVWNELRDTLPAGTKFYVRSPEEPTPSRSTLPSAAVVCEECGWDVAHGSHDADCSRRAEKATELPTQRIVNAAGTAAYDIPQYIEVNEDGSPAERDR